MSNRFRVHVALPPLAAGESGEVVSRKIRRVINDVERSTEDIGVEQVEYTFEALQGDHCVVALKNVDDAGNLSVESTRSFEVLDTIPPGAPGELQIRLEEIANEPAPPAPETEVPPATPEPAGDEPAP